MSKTRTHTEYAELLRARLGPELKKRNLLTALDERAFDLLCVHFGLFAEAAPKAIESGGYLVDGAGNLYLDPHLEIAVEQGQLLSELLAEFMIAPASDDA